MSVRTSAWPIQQAATEEHRRNLRCTWMLTRLLKLLWKAAWLEVDNESDVFLEGFIEWGIACLDARYFWQEERLADYWSWFLLRDGKFLTHGEPSCEVLAG
jgi:hypothetical protein